MSTPTTPIICPRCGVRNAATLGFCPACGYETKRSESSTHQANAQRSSQPSDGESFPTPASRILPKPVRSAVPQLPNSSFAGVDSALGLRTVSGVVIFVDAPYFTKRDMPWLISAAKVAFSVFVLGPLLIAAAFASLLLSPLLRGFFGHHQRSLAAGFIRQFTISYAMTKIFRPLEQVPVRDVRVREDSGREHLIRVKGDLLSGNFNVGDEVEVTCTDKQGTLIFRHGWNRRTRSKLAAKVP